MSVTELLRDLGFFTIGVGAVAYLAKKLTTQLLDKELERFKSTLQADAAKTQFRFERLHADRAEVIKELYKKLSAMERALRSAMSPLQLAGEPSIPEKLKAAHPQVNEFINYYYENKIYFDDPTCKMLDEIHMVTLKAWNEFTLMPAYGTHPDLASTQEATKHWTSAWNKIVVSLPEAKGRLEREFRKLLGTVE